jgi:predicted permease
MELIHRSSRSASGGIGIRMWSSVLIVGQVAVALVLLTGAGLLIRSFQNAMAVAPGFDPEQVTATRLAIPGAYRGNQPGAAGFQTRVRQVLEEMPGVAAVGLANGMPFQGGLPVNAFTLFEDTLPPGSPQPGAYRVFASPEYASTLKISVVEGRFFEPGDLAPNKRFFVVDENFAQKYFPGKSALGGRFNFGGRPEKDADWPTIIGVVRNVPHNGVEDRSGIPFIYQLLQPASPPNLTVFVRSTRAPSEILSLMREKLRGIDPALVLFDTGPLQAAIENSFNNRRAIMLLLGSFAALAMFLSAIGIYGVLAYDVSQRTQEIGIRGAIGASRDQVVGMIFRQGIWKTGLGLVIGLVGALLLSRLMTTLLFDVKPTDPAAYAVTAALLLIVAALASYLPARRAARIDPIIALRQE